MGLSMKKFLLLLCVSLCATRVYCAPTDDKYSWLTRLGMFLRNSPQQILTQLKQENLYTDLWLEELPAPEGIVYRVYRIIKVSNELSIAFHVGNIFIGDDGISVRTETFGGQVLDHAQQAEVDCETIIRCIAWNRPPQQFIEFLRKVFSKELDSKTMTEIQKQLYNIKNPEESKGFVFTQNKRCNSIIDEELAQAAQCGQRMMVRVAAKAAALYGLYSLRNEIATGVKNGTSSLVAAVASGLGK